MAQRKTKKQIIFEDIRIAHYALDLIKVKVQVEVSETDVKRLENITAKIKNIRWALDKLIVEM